jgi:hypothetical protein
MAKQNPYSTPARQQHPTVLVKVWPNAVTPSPTPLPGQTSKTTPTK